MGHHQGKTYLHEIIQPKNIYFSCMHKQHFMRTQVRVICVSCNYVNP